MIHQRKQQYSLTYIAKNDRNIRISNQYCSKRLGKIIGRPFFPCFGLKAHDRGKYIFPLSQYKKELLSIPKNTSNVIFVIALQDLERTNIQIKGRIIGFKRVGGFKYGCIENDGIYDSMVQFAGQK